MKILVANPVIYAEVSIGFDRMKENIGQSEMIRLFWANQIFSPNMPDTYWGKVKK